MRENLGDQLTVDDLARSAMFSKFHFTRMFQRATGISPGRFLSALRLQHAKYLLVSTSLNVADISLRVGYNSVGTFSSRFTRSIGMSPSNYRRRAGFTSHIPTDPEFDPGERFNARIHGDTRMFADHPAGIVFLGLFPNRIPEGRPVRCTVLHEPGPYSFESVPTGTWHLLAQTVSAEALARPGADHVGQDVSVASEGPLEIGPDTDLRVDLTFQPARDLDPPVLLALLDIRKVALATVAARAEWNRTPTDPLPLTTAAEGLQAVDRSAA
ncbi:helix-turn-helix domain-containing protein [Micromonospora sp. SH-82]